MNIEEIIEGCKAQELRAQKLLYERYSKLMYPVCLRYCKDGHSASSALQEAFLKVFRNISSLRDKDKIAAWIQRIVIYACFEQIKADKKFVFTEVTNDHYSNYTNPVEYSNSESRYLPLLNQLPEGYRLVFSLRVLEDMKHKEISKILGISEGTSRSQLAKARKMLKSIIEKMDVKMEKYG